MKRGAMETPYEDGMSEEQKNACRMIGFLAASIRGDWADVKRRLNVIRKLSKEVEKPEWVQQIDENRADIEYDGRWMRDYWDGPYTPGYDVQDIIDVGYAVYIGLFPDLDNDN